METILAAVDRDPRERANDVVSSPQRTWLDGRIDVLLAALGDYGMHVSRIAAGELVRERVRWVAAQMGFTPATARRYLTDDAIRGLARSMAVAVAEEAPGADVLESPRTAALPLGVLGRAVAGLSEAILLRLGERDDLDHVRTITAQLAQTLSALGQVAADFQDGGEPVTGIFGPPVMVPPALLNRAARYLEAAAALVREGGIVPDKFNTASAGQLADTFDKDAAALRYYAHSL